MESSVHERIDAMIKQHPVVVFMKGNPDAPQCGFSARVAMILQDHGKPFATFDVLSDPSIRQGIKEYASWPTIPQVYVDGEFLGGSDIVSEMYANGELQTKIDEAHAN